MTAWGIAVLALVSTDAVAQRDDRQRQPAATPTPSASPTPTVAATGDPRLDAAAGFGAAMGYAYGDTAAFAPQPPDPVRRRGSMAQGAPQWHAVAGGGVTTTSTGVGIAPRARVTRGTDPGTVVTTTTSEFAEPAPPARPARRRATRR
ncbi:hypothetical protein [Sphingomonas jinjuensis]|nr:hypothetical protein [Sphingomonas jinjuensis]